MLTAVVMRMTVRMLTVVAMRDDDDDDDCCGYEG